MAEDNVSLVRRGYEAWNRGDLEGIIARLDPEIQWIGHPALPESGPLRGPAEVRRWMEQFREAWDETAVLPEDLIEQGDQVIALVRISGRGRGSGLEISGGLDAHVWTFRAGKAIRVRMYQGTRDAARDTGLDLPTAGPGAPS